MKKASGKSKSKANKPAKKKASRRSKKPVDLVEVRKDISNIVGSEATELAKAVVGEGLKGQLAPVKYLFEAIGLYPAPEQNQAKPEEASLAKTLMDRLGIRDNPETQQDAETPVKRGLPANKSPNADEEESESSDSQPEKQNSLSDEEETDENDDAPVPAGSIP